MRIDRWKVRQLMATRCIASDAELARSIGVSRSTISRWFDGYPFTPENLGKLCDVLACTPNDILTREPLPKGRALAGAVA